MYGTKLVSRGQTQPSGGPAFALTDGTPYASSKRTTTRSMQGMFGASVSELYLLIKSLINIGRAVDLCVITKKYTAYTGTTVESGLAMIYS